MPSIAKNTFYMIAASVGQKVISLTYFTLIARALGAQKTGIYTAALAMTTIFVVFVDLGLTNVFIREASRPKAHINDYLATVLGIKLLTGFASYAAMWLVMRLLNFEPEFTKLVYLSGVTMLFDSLHLTLYGALRAFGNLKYESWGMVGSQFVTLVLGTIFLWLGLPLIFLILAFTISSFLNVIFAWFITKYKYNLNLLPKFDWPQIRLFCALAAPFALAAIFGRIYSYVDVVILKKLAGNEAVGFYSTPSKITFAFQFIPLALVAALYPKLSEYYANQKEKLSLALNYSLKYLLLIAAPLSVGIYVLSQDIIILFFTDQYLASVLPLKILIISLVFSFLSFPIGAFLNACDKQTTQTKITAAVLAINVILNFVLVPIYGAIGASISALVSNILLTGLGYMMVPSIVVTNHKSLLWSVSRIVGASLAMGLAVYYINNWIGIIPAILVGAMTYVALVFLTRSLTLSELKVGAAMLR